MGDFGSRARTALIFWLMRTRKSMSAGCTLGRMARPVLRHCHRAVRSLGGTRIGWTTSRPRSTSIRRNNPPRFHPTVTGGPGHQHQYPGRSPHVAVPLNSFVSAIINRQTSFGGPGYATIEEVKIPDNSVTAATDFTNNEFYLTTYSDDSDYPAYLNTSSDLDVYEQQRLPLSGPSVRATSTAAADATPALSVACRTAGWGRSIRRAVPLRTSTAKRVEN